MYSSCGIEFIHCCSYFCFHYLLTSYSVIADIHQHNGVYYIRPYVETIASRPIDNLSGSGDFYYNNTYQSHAYVAQTNVQTVENYGPEQTYDEGEYYYIVGSHYGSDYTWTSEKGWFWDYASAGSY